MEIEETGTGVGIAETGTGVGIAETGAGECRLQKLELESGDFRNWNWRLGIAETGTGEWRLQKLECILGKQKFLKLRNPGEKIKIREDVLNYLYIKPLNEMGESDCKQNFK